MSGPPYAHTLPNTPPSAWEPLFTPFGSALDQCQREHCEKCQTLEPYHGHLNKVAFWTAKFASEMFPSGSSEACAAWEWGYLTGLWHDLGKFAPDWQRYLKDKTDPHSDDISGRLDHATAGARFAVENDPLLGHIIAFAIAGHHSGLLDTTANHACQGERLRKSNLPNLPELPEGVTSPIVPNPPFRPNDAVSAAIFTRMLFSCLVDADFLATEAFMNPSSARCRNSTTPQILSTLQVLLDNHIAAFPRTTDTVNCCRRRVVEDCQSAAGLDPGIFTLSVPTGGGKTLSSMAFALRHALAHEMKRVIYVAPFTSIIEQNAEVVRKIFATAGTPDFDPVIEHHSALSPERETAASRLAAENWDAPIIITTAVQFLESLHAAKTSRCRKLHHIANSVVILDEAQTLPVDLLQPTLRTIAELAEHYHTTIVLCTATQPAIGHDESEFPIGLRGIREIIRDPATLFVDLRRVRVESLGDTADATLAHRLKGHHQALCIVNLKNHARALYQMLGHSVENFHLSTLMCPEHRSLKLAEIRARLARDLPTRVISTQLIEAGVDVDFPVVYRSMAGLDSIAQAAGRCNRNGHLPEPGITYLFRSEHTKGETYFRETAQIAWQLHELHPDPLTREAIRHYFDLYYYQQRHRWDAKDILGGFATQHIRELPFRFQFAETAAKYRIIDDWQVPVIIPYDERARKLIVDLRNPTIPLHRNLLRSLQRYTVSIPPRLRDTNLGSLETLRDGSFHALISTDLHYSPHFGLTFDEENSSRQFLHVGE